MYKSLEPFQYYAWQGLCLVCGFHTKRGVNYKLNDILILY